MNGITPRLWTELLGEERPREMMTLLAILVVLLHLWLFQWLTQSNDVTTPAKPLVMAVSMITISAPKPVVAPAQPAPPPPQPKPLPKKSPPKVVEKKPPPIVQKAPDFAPSEPISEPKVETQAVAPSAVTSNTATDAASKSAPVPATEDFVVSKPRDGERSQPPYPKIAFSRRWSGTVKLKLHISAEGKVIEATIENSSGHEILDETALKWVKEDAKFLPATRGGTPVDSLVFKSYDFKIKDKSD